MYIYFFSKSHGNGGADAITQSSRGVNADRAHAQPPCPVRRVYLLSGTGIEPKTPFLELGTV